MIGLFREIGHTHADFDNICDEMQRLFTELAVASDSDDFDLVTAFNQLNIDSTSSDSSLYEEGRPIENSRDIALAALYSGNNLQLAGFERPIDANKVNAVRRKLDFNE